MPRIKGRHVVLYRTKLTIAGLTSFFVLLLLFTSCHKEQRRGILQVGLDDAEFHKVLTLFFDGVPPLSVENVEEQMSDPNSTDLAQNPEIIWYIHEPQKDCVRCHGNQQQRTF